jgi:hypothetical protein
MQRECEHSKMNWRKFDSGIFTYVMCNKCGKTIGMYDYTKRSKVKEEAK